MEKQLGKMMIYCCGGAGINIGKYFTSFRDSGASGGFAEMQAVYIDTSLSNLSPEIKENEVYLIDGLDGSGKVRAENYREISETIHDVLLKYAPGDVNVVLSSTGGGSGSVIAPSIVTELLKRDKNVVVASITSTDSRIEIENSVKTLKSYESIATLRKTPVVMLQYENSTDNSRASVNTKVQDDVVRLAALFSRQNKELDSADLRNWLNYTRVTKHEPKLVVLDFAHGPVESGKAQILTVATLAYEGMQTSVGSPIDYQCVGYVTPENENGIKLTSPTHYLVIDGLVGDTYRRLSTALANIDEMNLAKKRTAESLVTDTDKVLGDGLIL